MKNFVKKRDSNFLITNLSDGIDFPLTKFDDESRNNVAVDRDKFSSPVSKLR